MDETPDGERGRYYAVRTGPQSMEIYRATGLCETCSNCGCGHQEEPIDLSPGGIMKMVSAAGIDMRALLGGMRRARSGAGSNGG